MGVIATVLVREGHPEAESPPELSLEDFFMEPCNDSTNGLSLLTLPPHHHAHYNRA